MRKVLSKKVHSRSLNSIHILYKQALVGGLSDNFDPSMRIAKFQLNGGSNSRAEGVSRFISLNISRKFTQDTRHVPIIRNQGPRRDSLAMLLSC